MGKEERRRNRIRALMEAGVPNKYCYPVIKVYQQKEGGAWRVSLKCETHTEVRYFGKKTKWESKGKYGRSVAVEYPWLVCEVCKEIRAAIPKFCAYCDYELCPELDGQVVEKRYWCQKQCEVFHCSHNTVKSKEVDKKYDKEP